MITSRAVSAPPLYHRRRVAVRHALNYDFAGALPHRLGGATNIAAPAIAIPHRRSTAVTEPTLAMARPENPVDFGAKDGPADLVFIIAGSAGLTPVDPAVIAAAGAVDVDVDGRLRFIGTDDGLRTGRTRQKGADSVATPGRGAAPSDPGAEGRGREGGRRAGTSTRVVTATPVGEQGQEDEGPR